MVSSILRFTREDLHDKNRLLFANPNNKITRVNMTVRMSDDEGENWAVSKVVNPAVSAYSDLVIHDDMSIGLFYERNGDIRYSSFTLDWLTEGQDSLDRSKFK